MDLLEDNELTLSQQIFNLQIDLQNQLSCDSNQIDGQKAIFDYLDHILVHKSVTIDDFGDDVDWINVSQSLSLRRHMNGLIVVMDFFTYCCINCLHILPKLRQIETQMKSESVVVIGIHSPKFHNEKDITNVCESVLKYDINHPIANDPNANVWSSLDIQCWPTIMILGPNCEQLFTLLGETEVEKWLQLYTESSLKYFERKNFLINENKSKIPMKLLKNSFDGQLLGFPAKVNSSEDQQLIVISNARYHNIMIVTNNGFIKHIIGGNESGFRDGSFSAVRFNGPNGVFWKDNTHLFVADTQNHSIRLIDISGQTVTTIAGNGRQCDDRIGGKIGCDQGLNSPWDVCAHNDLLFIAMAGCHQIWVLTLEDNTKVLNKLYPKGSCFSFAGNGVEQNRNNRYPQNASFAQPSGLALDAKNNCIYIADSESSSIRAVDIENGWVSAIVGGDRNPENLFAFGDTDGKGVECRLQHCLGIHYDLHNHCLFVADSYNHKIKKINISSKECISIAGTGIKGNTSDCRLSECAFSEPNGLCLINDSKNLLITDTNNHCLKLLDLENDFVFEFKLIHLKEKTKRDFNLQTNDSKTDFTIVLDSIDFNIENELKLRFVLDFGSKIKLTKDAKHVIVFLNPDEELFSTTHKEMKIECFEKVSEFCLKIKNKDNFNDCLNRIYSLIIYTNFNLCNFEQNFCKQIKVDFHLPLVMTGRRSECELIAELPFTLKSL